MSNIPSELRYTKDHEWLRDDGAGLATIGITDYAQGSLGDVTFVDLPKVGKTFAAHQTFGVVESVKAASDLYMPVAAEVVELNPAVAGAPETLNRDPYGAGWLVKIKPANPSDLAALLDAEAYRALTA